MCKVLKVSRSGYYEWLKRKPSQRQKANEVLLAAIQHVYQASRQTYGSPRIHAALQQQGIIASRNRIRAIDETAWTGS